MKDKWKVSVLTPVHNTPIEQLTRAYRSLLDQSFGFSGIQWVVVLHNCERDYITRVRELLGDQMNICLSEVSQEGTGVSFARNATLERAEGTYLFFLDSDDEMLPDCIGTVVDEMETAGADTAIFVAKVEGGNGMAVYYTDEHEKSVTEAKIKALEAESGRRVPIAVEAFKSFWPAEEYHQDYYLKNPEAFERELIESGRKKI